MLRAATLWLAVAGVGHAQTPNTCDVKRNNEPYFYTAAATDPTTGRAYNMSAYQPPGYWSQLPTDPGVALGDLTWRWIPNAVNRRGSTRQVSGFYVYLRPSAPTVNFPFTGYIPEWSLWPTRVRADGGHEPDPLQVPLHVVPQASFVFPSAGAHRARSVFSAAVPLDADDVCFAMRWAGGEHRLLTGSQGFVGTQSEAPWDVPTWGHADAAGVGAPVDTLATLGQYTTLWASYYETEPSIVVESDYAHQGVFPPQAPLHSGFNDAAGLSDLVTDPLQIGWNVAGGLQNAGNICVPMFNLSPTIHATPQSLLGQTIEIDPLNPLIGELYVAGYGGFCDATGFFDGPRATVSQMGIAAQGWYFGTEFLILDAITLQIVGSTQSHWMRIQ